MPGTITERALSRPFTIGPGGGDITFTYFVQGTQNLEDVLALVNATAPLTLLGVPRGQVTGTPVGHGLWECEVPYSTNVKSAADQSTGQPPAGSDSHLPTGAAAGQGLGREYTFSTGGGTVRVKIAKEHISDHGALGAGGVGPEAPAPNHKGLINVTREGGKTVVEGVDISAPNAEFTISKRLSFLSWGYFKTLLRTTARTNDQPWGPFKQDEALFLGGDGQFRDGDQQAPWSLACRFHYEETNSEVIEIGDVRIPVGAKHGHYYLWVEYQDVVDDNSHTIVSVPFAAHLERVYDRANFNQLGLI